MPFVPLEPGEAPRGFTPLADNKPQRGFTPITTGDAAPGTGTNLLLNNPLTAAGEAGLNLASQAVALPVAGIAGLATEAGRALGLTDKTGADTVHAVAGGLTYQPRGELGKAAAEIVAYPFEKLAEAGQYAGGKTLEGTGSPLAATAVDTAINAAPMLIGPAKKGGAIIKERRAWAEMIRRCSKPANKAWKYYGGRGITVCPEWMASFSQFLADVGPAPTPGAWLGRLDVRGHYEPRNCVWTTPMEQGNRRGYCRKVEVNGRVMTPAQASRLPGSPGPLAVVRRLEHGLPLNPSAAKAYRKSPWLTFNGVTLQLAEMAKLHGVPRVRLWWRLKAGWPLEAALNPQPANGRKLSLTPTLAP